MISQFDNNLILKLIEIFINNLSKEIYNRYGEEITLVFLERFKNFFDDKVIYEKIFLNESKEISLSERLRNEFANQLKDIIPDFEDIFDYVLAKIGNSFLEERQ